MRTMHYFILCRTWIINFVEADDDIKDASLGKAGTLSSVMESAGRWSFVMITAYVISLSILLGVYPV